MLETLRSLASVVWIRSLFRKKLQSDQWFSSMSMYVAEVFDKTARTDLKFNIEETQFVIWLRNQADQSARQKIGEELVSRLYEVSAHPASDTKARVIECRKWTLALANEHGRFKVALVTDRDWSSIPNYPRHACVKGLGDYLEQLLAVEFTEFHDNSSSTDAAIILLKARNLRLHFDLSVANTGRALLGDIDPKADWLISLMNTIMAVHEARMRAKLNLPPVCARSYPSLISEYETFTRALLAGEPNPLETMQSGEA